jgi:hypothetical protein
MGYGWRVAEREALAMISNTYRERTVGFATAFESDLSELARQEAIRW